MGAVSHLIAHTSQALTGLERDLTVVGEGTVVPKNSFLSEMYHCPQNQTLFPAWALDIMDCGVLILLTFPSQTRMAPAMAGDDVNHVEQKGRTTYAVSPLAFVSSDPCQEPWSADEESK